MTRTIALLPFLLIACDSSEEPTTDDSKTKSSTTSTQVESSTDVQEESSSLDSPDPSLAAASSDSDESAELVPSWSTEVGSGESLVLISKWAGTSVEAIGELNGLDVRDSIYPGQSLKLPLEGEEQIQAFREARADGHQARLERYVDSRGGLAEVDVHIVRTGDTAWGIAQDNGIDSWVLARFNEDMDLARLDIGDPLQVPVMADTVASLEVEEVDSIPAETIGLPIDYD